jgi:hypothetical protein
MTKTLFFSNFYFYTLTGDHPAAMYHEHRSSATQPYRDKSSILLDKIFYVYFVLFDITVYILLL